MKMLGKSIVNKELIPYLSLKKKGFIFKKVGLWRIIDSIIFKLKTDTQWHHSMKKYKRKLDLSSVDLDGSHTVVKNGGEQVGYQGRKKTKTTNMLFITDRKGNVIGCSDPIIGNHDDTFEIEKVMPNPERNMLQV